MTDTDQGPIHIAITTPSGGTRMTSSYIANIWAGAGEKIALTSFLPGVIPDYNHDNISAMAIMERAVNNPSRLPRPAKVFLCFILMLWWFIRVKPHKIMVIGMPLSVVIMVISKLFFWRKIDVAVLVDTHASGNLRYKKTRANSWTFSVMSKITHNPILYRYVMRHAVTIVALNQSIANDMIDIYRAPDNKVMVIPPMVDGDYFTEKLPKKRPNDMVLFLGRISSQKNCGDLIRAFAMMHQSKPSSRLVMVGDGEEINTMKKMAMDCGVGDAIDFVGYQDNPKSYLHQATCLALTSHYEGFPLVIIEACAMGVPVISYDCPSGPSDILQDGVNGVIVPQYDVDAMANTLETALDYDWNPEKIHESVLHLHPDLIAQKYRECLGVLNAV